MNSFFGTWFNDADKLNEQFKNADPYPHVVIDGFLSEEQANLLTENFPALDSSWVKYWNPLEKKYALNKFEQHPVFKRLFDLLQTDEFVAKMKELTGIANLESDPHLHGAGVHYHPTGGKLDMHLDYSVHPISGKERRINIILYLNRDWDESYNGDIQLWDKGFTGPVKRVYPYFNRAVVFQTSDLSWHGLPTPLRCPDGMGRKSWLSTTFLIRPVLSMFVRKHSSVRCPISL
jgi:Rps23 Pro-64 3,4-dihydroxylase Tpa1-like proline 4-hydroxylase